jgi:enamine deaminase RidA (YjgF/YER057c/UK114 family)
LSTASPSWRSRLAELDVELPEPAAPLASYLPAVRTGNLVFTSGQLPLQAGKLARTGKVGAEVSPEEGSALARICAVNALAAVDALVGVDSVSRIVKVVGYVASAPGFNGQPGVINGASDLFGAVFGEAGRHARSAVGVSELPLDAPVEVELVSEVR